MKCEEDYIKCSWGGESGWTEGQECVDEKCNRKTGGWESEGGGEKGQKVKGLEVLCVLLMQFKDWICHTYIVLYIIFKSYSNL